MRFKYKVLSSKKGGVPMKFQSFLSDILETYIVYRKASGRDSIRYLLSVRLFDRYCAREYPSAKELSQGMVDQWCKKRNTESSNYCISRIYPVITFLHYANIRGLTNVNIPAPPRSTPRTYMPHAFTVEELQNFFYSCDSINTKYGLVGKIKKITVPVFFRFLYSNGMRTTEVRLLRRKDVNLENGVINIRYSKGYNQHFVVLHDTMLDLMKKYDVAISKMIPDRIFFFPTSSNKGYPGSWVTRIFKKYWFENNKASAIAYELRHHYAVENINSWIGRGLTTHILLLSLSKSMGHTNVENTKYYYSLVPGLSEIIENTTNEMSNQIIPNLQDDEES
jgi:site-specific recombinase XerD